MVKKEIIKVVYYNSTYEAIKEGDNGYIILKYENERGWAIDDYRINRHKIPEKYRGHKGYYICASECTIVEADTSGWTPQVGDKVVIKSDSQYYHQWSDFYRYGKYAIIKRIRTDLDYRFTLKSVDDRYSNGYRLKDIEPYKESSDTSSSSDFKVGDWVTVKEEERGPGFNYSEAPSKVEEPKEDKMEALLKEAKIRYPRGTKVKCLYDGEVTTSTENFFVYGEKIKMKATEGSGCNQHIYRDGEWAKVVTESEIADTASKFLEVGTKVKLLNNKHATNHKVGTELYIVTVDENDSKLTYEVGVSNTKNFSDQWVRSTHIEVVKEEIKSYIESITEDIVDNLNLGKKEAPVDKQHSSGLAEIMSLKKGNNKVVSLRTKKIQKHNLS